MNLEHGKRYVTRCGMVTPPISARHGGISFELSDDTCMQWNDYGVLLNPKIDAWDRNDLDIVTEYIVLEDEQDDATCLEPEPFCVTEMMIKYGGRFVQALGKAYRQADDVNSAIIRKSFKKYWQRYVDMYRQKEKQSYRGWWIEYMAPGEWRYVHQDYDGTVDGNDHRIGHGVSFLDAVDGINEYILENERGVI